jgi:hypothetical protein
VDERPSVLDWFLKVAGVLVVAWGMLLMLTLGLTVAGVGAAAICVPYGVAIIHAEQRAVTLGWTTTIFMGIMAVLVGSPPVLVVVWTGFFMLSMILIDYRERLRPPRSRPLHDRSGR